uniref:Condensin-2 complex subunit H2 n=1 Tax=Aegilops tauschii TaxID=37682 RepID=N1QQL6_AEGTA
MEDGNGGGEGSTSGGRFPILQANRDPESNWEVDVAKSLEEYLLKICSGEISGEDFNFAEGLFNGLRVGRWIMRKYPPPQTIGWTSGRLIYSSALLLQGSVQVYSRKVEYLYSLVLHALEFLSQNKPDQQGKGSAEANESDPSTTSDKEDDMFLGLDDVPAETRITLGNNLDRDELRRIIVRPPANLLVFEGDCVDSEASELDSYLLATCGFYGDFLLLDPCDAPAVFAFLQGKNVCKEDILSHGGGSAPSKRRNNVFTSPNARSGGTARRKTPGEVPRNAVQPEIEKSQETNPGESPANNWPDHRGDLTPDLSPSQPEYVDPGCPDLRDDSDDEDPYKSLDPHEPSNLKIKPYKRVKCFPRQVIGAPKKKTLASIFPAAKMDGVVSPELTKYVVLRMPQLYVSQSVPLYEKVLQLLLSFESGDKKRVDEPNPSMHDSDDEPDIPTYPDDGLGSPIDQPVLNIPGSMDALCQSHLQLGAVQVAKICKVAMLASVKPFGISC